MVVGEAVGNGVGSSVGEAVGLFVGDVAGAGVKPHINVRIRLIDHGWYSVQSISI